VSGASRRSEGRQVLPHRAAYGSFSRSIALPQTVNEDGIAAKYENGVLEVSVPKAEVAKPKKIAVAIGEQKPQTVEATATESSS